MIVALVGNAAEHGGAIVIARRGNVRLGAEIAISSSTQVAAFVAPVVALASGLIGRGLPLAFRPVEIGAMAVAAAVAVLVALDGAHAPLGGLHAARRSTRSPWWHSRSPATAEAASLYPGVVSCDRVNT